MKKLILLASVFALLSCGGNDAETKKMMDEANAGFEASQKEQKIKDSIANLPPKEISFEEALKDTVKDEHKVVIEGYLALATLTSISDEDQSMNLYGRKNQSTGNYVYTTMPIKEKNGMKKLPEKYTPADVFIKDANGADLGLNERVRLTGKMYASESYSEKGKYTIYFTVTNIEKAEEKAFDYSTANWPTLDKATAEKADDNKGKEFMVEGVVDIPMFVMTGYEMGINVKNAKGEIINVKVITGTGSSMMENLAENWTAKDIKIHDAKGNLINNKKKVKMYGVLALDGLHIEEIVQ